MPYNMLLIPIIIKGIEAEAIGLKRIKKPDNRTTIGMIYKKPAILTERRKRFKITKLFPPASIRKKPSMYIRKRTKNSGATTNMIPQMKLPIPTIGKNGFTLGME